MRYMLETELKDAQAM